MSISKGKLQLDKRFSRGDARRRQENFVVNPTSDSAGGGCPAQARKIRILLVHAGGDARAGETILHSVSPTSDSARGEARRRRDFFCICDSHKRISKGGGGGEARRRRIFFGIGVVFYTISHSESIENYHRIPKFSPAAPSDRVTGYL